LEICGLVASRWCYPMECYLIFWIIMCETRLSLKDEWHWTTCIMKHQDFARSTSHYIHIKKSYVGP
jgi:hypothetical protein